ncbi:family 10 glycosylhydrolase [Paenibacillus dauci]|uniref:family 10 glycosylhydrolase n=1 Tax=Paenibacillus dauci TaxID=1567106 RepID=UPI000696DEC2|nr:family 10 glycosylhydrolase [Paenibacillus dauci]
MKIYRYLSLFLAIVVVFPLVSSTLYAADTNIKIVLDGKAIQGDAAPYITSDTNVTMVPLRLISENMGAEIAWDQPSSTVTITHDNDKLVLTAGQPTATVNSKSVALDTSVQIKSGRVMVPLRFIGEGLGLGVNWNQSTQTVTLTTGGGSGSSTGSADGKGSTLNASPSTKPTGNGTTASKELRGAWISTVFNLDWPSSSNAAKQKQEFSKQLDDLQSMGMNAVFVQVRPSGDALYQSATMPWSKFLTGTQGKNPGYDPLEYMVSEAHKRGMEIHAWFNPFRATTDSKTATLASNHVVRQHPDWVIYFDGKYYINPGIPAARQSIIDTVMEVVNNYDVDGVHMDDYFYPSSETSSKKFNDDKAYTAYKGNSTSKSEWRRNNINSFVRDLGKSIHASKPSVRFGISPFGVWRNKSNDITGSDTKAGVTAYDSMYADTRTWIKNGWIDYIAPQVYWSFSLPAAHYDKVVDWWANETKNTGVDLYIGQAIYKINTPEIGWNTSNEIINQMKYNEKYSNIKGSIFFSYKDLKKNPLDIVSKLKSYWSL